MRCDQLRIKTDHPTDHKNMKKLKMDNKERGPKCQLEWNGFLRPFNISSLYLERKSLAPCYVAFPTY
jgi:hypothetical protein